MLQGSHARYDRLYVYYFDRCELPAVTDPDHIGTWIEDDKAILFFHSPKEELVGSLCRAVGASVIYQADLGYMDWEAGRQIGPFRTDTFAVRPVWDKGGGDPADLRHIVIDPSVVFGSGFHATTRMCLENLERLMTGPDQRMGRVLDLGTGTGLLAIACVKLGASHVTAVDNNPLACAVARKNISLNSCQDRVEVVESDIAGTMPATDNYDLVIANLYKGLLLSLFASPQFWQARYYVLSGFMPGMEGELLAALPAKMCRVLRRDRRDNWRLWLLENTSAR